MIRTVKSLLALMSVTLLFAVTAGGAQATPTFEAGSYPAAVKGTANVVIGTEGGEIRCPIDYSGTLEGKSSTLELAMFIQFYNCLAFGFIGVTVENPGCAMVFHATEKEAADQYKGLLSVSCFSGDGFTLTGGACAAEIKEQEGLATVDLDDSTGPPKRVAADFEISELEYEVITNHFLCFSGGGTKTDGTITGNPFQLKAVNPSKTTEEVGLAVSGE